MTMHWMDEYFRKVDVEADGTVQPRRAALNFVGATVSDDEPNDRTTITIPAPYVPPPVGQATIVIADADQAIGTAYPMMRATGALTANRTLTFPAPADDAHAYSCVVRNATTGGHDVLVTTGAGETLSVAPGMSALIGFDMYGAFEAQTRVSPPPAPTWTNILPDNGPAAGGTAVTITGAHFQPGATVTFDYGGSDPQTVVASGWGSTITCVSPAHAAATVAIRITNPDGQFLDEVAAFQFT